MPFNLKRTGALWDRNQRININDNWDMIEGFIKTNGESLFDSETFLNWLNDNNFKPKDPVETFEDLPGNPDNKELRGVLDENAIYIYNGDEWVKYSEVNYDELETIRKNIPSRSIMEFGATGTGESVSEIMDTAIKSISESGGGTLRLPKGEYYIPNQITVPSNVNIVGDGDKTVIKTNGQYNLFNVQGSYGDTLSNFTNPVERGGDRLFLDDTSPFNDNDYVKIIGQRHATSTKDNDLKWVIGKVTAERHGVYHGEIAQVKQFDNASITLQNGVMFPSYRHNKDNESHAQARNASSVRKINFAENVKIGGFKIEGRVKMAVSVSIGRNIIIEDITWDDIKDDAGVRLIESYNCEVRNCRFYYTKKGISEASENAIQLTSTTACGAKDNIITNHARSAFDCTYQTASEGSEIIVGIYNYFEGNEMFNCEKGLTTHGGTMGSIISNNRFLNCTSSGIETRSRDSTITGNYIIGLNRSGYSSFGINLYDGFAHDCLVDGNFIKGFDFGVMIRSHANSPFEYIGAMISNNIINRCGTGISFLDPSNSVKYCDCNTMIKGNIISDFYGDGYGKAVRIDSNHFEITINGNRFIGNSATNAGVYAASNSYNIWIQDNYFRGFGNSSVWVVGMSDDHDHEATNSNAHRGDFYLHIGASNIFDQLPSANNINALRGSRGVMFSSQIPYDNDEVWLGTGDRRFRVLYSVLPLNTSSDVNDKSAIQNETLGIDFINQLNPVSYKRKDDNDKVEHGLIAQDVEKALKQLGLDNHSMVSKDNDKYGLNYTEMLAPIIKAIQDLNKKIDK